jgi:uncharacterized protein with NAD-binding domain and iron-sulfur cluster
MPDSQPVTRVAILGGGMAALSTAAALVQAQQVPGAPRYEITIHQLGWRVGGKGASGRNRAPDMGLRIEEHGLHVWFGCYHDAWKLLGHCYDALGRPDDLAKLFQGQTDTPYMEDMGGWKVWPVHFPRKYGTLGDGSLRKGVPGYSHALGMYLVTMGRAFAEQARARSPDLHPGQPGLLHRLFSDTAGAFADLERRVSAVGAFLRSVASPGADTDVPHRNVIIAAEAVRLLMFADPSPLNDIDDDLRRLGIMFDLGLTALKGLWADRVWETGFDALDKEDARAWFTRHGAAQTSIDAAPMRALYDLCFAYRGGKVGWEQADFGAGAALTTVLRIACEYPDYVVYEMRAGMGEVVIAPIYQYLKQNGVRFAFFHQVDRLELDAQAKQVVAVHLTEQAHVKGGGEYDPLFTVDCPLDGIPSLAAWPSEPKYELLENGDALRGYNLESHWSGWPGVGSATLRAGTDYDLLVLAVSLDSVRELCADFGVRVPGWAPMFDKMCTVQTASAQLWMMRSLTDLGWTSGAVPVDAAPEPLDVWADRSDVLQRECWKVDLPKSLHYLCGPLDESWAHGLPRDPSFPVAGKAAAVALTQDWITANAGAIWPASVLQGAFDWSLLRDPSGASGPARLKAQYVRANIDPSERYVLSVAGSTATRLTAGGSNLSNLVLAGDWTHSDWNAGCIETAVDTGINAANAVQAKVTGQAPPPEAA